MIQILTPPPTVAPDAEPPVPRARPARLKLPAYGKALLQRRRADDHPLCVHLVIGDDWRAPVKCSWQMPGEVHPLLAIKPDDCRAGVFDWRPVAGLNVVLLDQAELALDFQNPDAAHARNWGHGPFYFLLGEIALLAADIEIIGSYSMYSLSAFRIAYSLRDSRLKQDPEKNNGWPSWWSDEIETLNAKRRQTWCRAAFIERHEHQAAPSC